MSRKQRTAIIERDHPKMSITAQTELLSLNRTSLYYQSIPPSAKEVAGKHRIDEIYTNYSFYGSCRITVFLRKEMLINCKTVKRYMREMGNSAICAGPNLNMGTRSNTRDTLRLESC